MRNRSPFRYIGMQIKQLSINFWTLTALLAYLLYGVFCFLMVEISWQYISLNTDVAFLRIKQDHIGLWYYKIGFFIHAFSSIFVLPAGFTQFNKWIRTNYRKVHRIMGKIYIGVVVLLAAPSGLLLGIYANGGIGSQIAFCTLAVLWFTFTLQAYLKIRSGNVLEHQKFMIRSFALTLSAITLRLWKVILVGLFHPRPMDVYQIIAWLGWVLNLAVAEWIIYKYIKK